MGVADPGSCLCWDKQGFVWGPGWSRLLLVGCRSCSLLNFPFKSSSGGSGDSVEISLSRGDCSPGHSLGLFPAAGRADPPGCSSLPLLQFTQHSETAHSALQIQQVSWIWALRIPSCGCSHAPRIWGHRGRWVLASTPTPAVLPGLLLPPADLSHSPIPEHSSRLPGWM